MVAALMFMPAKVVHVRMQIEDSNTKGYASAIAPQPAHAAARAAPARSRRPSCAERIAPISCRRVSSVKTRGRDRRVAPGRQHRQQLAEKVVADPLPLRRIPLLAPRKDDSFARQRRQHHLVQQPILVGDERMRLAAHLAEDIGRPAPVGARLGQAELDLLLQAGDPDLKNSASWTKR